MNPNELSELHKRKAEVLSRMIDHQGAFFIHAGLLTYVIIPGSMHYEQMKHILSDFGCDHAAKKLLADVNNCTTDQHQHAGQ